MNESFFWLCSFKQQEKKSIQITNSMADDDDKEHTNYAQISPPTDI